MSSAKISELRKVFASALREEDMLVISLAPDERGGGNETVSISLGELRKYLRMPPVHVQSKIGVASITEGIAQKPSLTPEQREQENRAAETFMSRMKKLAGKEQPPVKVSSGFTETTLAAAIADAKAVRQTVLANAKQALEDAFKNNSHMKEIDRRLMQEFQKPLGEK